MSTLVKVARYHLVDRVNYALLPIAITAFSFLINLAIVVIIDEPSTGNYSGGLVALYVFWFIAGTMTLTRSLPFGFALGLSRRSYYLGTVGFAVALAAAYALGITALQAVERGTGGWGLAVHFFRVEWILDGPWYLTWLTSFVLLMLVFGYGMWFGLVYRRWNLLGLWVFIAAQVTVLLAVVAVIGWQDAWSQVGTFLAGLTVLGLTGALAAVAVALTLGGFGTMRRVTV